MKKTLILIAAILGFAVVASAQPRAIGVRAGYGGEFSYQHGFGNSFAELDLGWWGNNHINLVGIYDFIIGGNGQVNVYLGPGAQLSIWNNAPQHTSQMNVGLAGQFGVEWNIPTIPLQLSLDWRPVFFFLNDGGFGYDSVGLGIRYRF
ncbi:MAG: hypothetical protein J6P62_07310 [Bacteroidales bacterium]|nr:hypothetical protein [Bacteroidales bacterium]